MTSQQATRTEGGPGIGLFDDQDGTDAGGGKRAVQAGTDALASASEALSEEVSVAAETVSEYAAPADYSTGYPVE